MDKAQVEENMLKIYPEYIKRIGDLIERCLHNAYSFEHAKFWIENHDARFAIYGKYINVLNATRISLFQNITFLSDKEWTTIYNKKFSIQNEHDNFIYLNVLDAHMRFASFMNFVSQFEASILIITRHFQSIGKKHSDNYNNFIIDNLKLTSWRDFLRLVRHLRNSIHNNGIHIPDKIQYNDNYIIFKETEYKFNRGRRVKLDWSDCFNIYEELIELTNIVFNHALVKQEKLIKDIVVNS